MDDEGHVTRTQKHFPTENEAKRKSRAIQMKEQEGLGRGILQVK